MKRRDKQTNKNKVKATSACSKEAPAPQIAQLSARAQLAGPCLLSQIKTPRDSCLPDQTSRRQQKDNHLVPLAKN